MSTETRSTEEMILATNPTRPRLTPADIESVIVDAMYLRPTGTLTICVLTLRNGCKVTGESACVSPENFNEAIGQKVARENAVRKIWELEGYLLLERLYHGNLATKNAQPVDPIRERFSAIVRGKLGLPSDMELLDDSRFCEDHGADSLDEVELVVAMEDAFNIEITDDEASKCPTVATALALVKSKAKEA